MSGDGLTLERIDELLRFLPLLRGDAGPLEIGSAGGEQVGDNVISIPFPVYPDEVLDFFLTAGRSWWADYDYVNHPASKKLDDAEFIAGCSLDELRTMLTACVRGERFTDGFWIHCLESGIITRLLHRLAELREGLFANGSGDAPREANDEDFPGKL